MNDLSSEKTQLSTGRKPLTSEVASQVKNKTTELLSTKQLSETLGVSERAIQLIVNDFPKNFSESILRKSTGGRPTMLFNTEQATAIKIALQNHTKVAKNGFDTLTISNDLEMLEVQRRLSDYQNRRIAELQAEIAQKQERIGELENQVEYNKVIDCRRWTDVKKEYHLTKLNKDKVKEALKEEVDWFEKCMGKDKFPTLLIKPQAIIKLVQINASI